MVRRWIGLDLGGTNTVVGVVEAGEVIYSWRTPTKAGEGPQAWVERVGEVVGRLARDYGAGGVGLGCPGVVEPRTGRVDFSPNLPQFNGFYLARALEEVAGVAVVMDNDANLYGLGEWAAGAGAGSRAMACLTLGTGVGGALVVEGRVVRGAVHAGGELGHVVVFLEGRRCRCGGRGCVEAYASAWALEEMVREALDAGAASRLGRDAGPEEIARAAGEGDSLAREVLELAGQAVGRVVAMVVAAVGVDVVVVGGGVSGAWEFMAAGAQAALRQMSTIVKPQQVRLARAALGELAPLLGGAIMAAQAIGGQL